MHKHLMSKVKQEKSLDGKHEEYVDFLKQKQSEFNQHIEVELQKAQKLKKDSSLMKIKCFEVLQKLFEKQIDLLVGKR